MENWLVSCVEEVFKSMKEVLRFALQQSHLLRQQRQHIVISVPVYYVWHIFLKDGESGITFAFL